MALLSPNGSVPPGKKSIVLTVYNVFCCLSGSTGIFFPEILPVKNESAHTVPKYGHRYEREPGQAGFFSSDSFKFVVIIMGLRLR